MGTDPLLEIERCLSQELRIERDTEGRVVAAKAGSGSLQVDWQASVARFNSEHGTSSWSAGVATHDFSYGTWEQSSANPSSLDAFIDETMRFLREGLMSSAATEAKQLCRRWFAYGLEHGLAIGAMDEGMLWFYLLNTSLADPQEILALARAIDRHSRPDLWTKILQRIDCFPPKKKRLIQQELGLEARKPAKPKGG